MVVAGAVAGDIVAEGTVAIGNVAGDVLIELLVQAAPSVISAGRTRTRTLGRVMAYSTQFRAVQSF